MSRHVFTYQSRRQARLGVTWPEPVGLVANHWLKRLAFVQLAVLLDCNLGAIGACQVVIRLASKCNICCALGEMIIASVEATWVILPWIIGANYQRLFRADQPILQGQKILDAEFSVHLHALFDAINTGRLPRKMAIRICKPMRANYHFALSFG